MASSKEKTFVEMFEKLAFKDSNDDCHTLDPVQKKTDVNNEVVHENQQAKNQVVNDPSEASKSSKVEFDDKSFKSSQFEEGDSSKEYEGTDL